MSLWVIIGVALAYLGVLFSIAYYGNALRKKRINLVANPYTYALSLAIYCTAWTFYGSVGQAASSGSTFLAIYLGPTLMIPIWYLVLRKIIVISRFQRINSIADFISARYGKSSLLGGLVALIAIMGIIPYIALQLKAISSAFTTLYAHGRPQMEQMENPDVFYQDTALYVALILAVFAILFGTRKLEANERHEGLMAAVAFESVVKLLAFLAVGAFVCWGVFDSPARLFEQAYELPELRALFVMDLDGGKSWTWFSLMVLSMLAFILLPRQFHVAVIENTSTTHLNRAMWLLPLYLLLINVFVIPIAFGGVIQYRELFATSPRIAESFVLYLPLDHGQPLLALLVFLGGLAASTSMVIVATLALGIMASNSLIFPLWLKFSAREAFSADRSAQLLLNIRRAIIVGMLLLAYGYVLSLNRGYTLVSIGLISFVAVAQFGPCLLAGIYWKDASRKGALAGLSTGFLIWLMTLPIPSLAESGVLDPGFLEAGYGGMALLRPYALLGVEGLDKISHAFLWSMIGNITALIVVSIYTTPTAMEHTQASIFVDIHKHSSGQYEFLWRGEARLHDIRALLNRFLGYNRTKRILQEHAHRRKLSLGQMEYADAELIGHAERTLAGAIGAASSRLLIASVVKEAPLRLTEVMEVLDETQEIVRYSRKLEEKSRDLQVATDKLQEANERLRRMDQLKDDFLTTVTHELRTPITSIRALSNILADHPDLPQEKRSEFLSIIIEESERLSRLINQVLDLEKMESGHVEWKVQPVELQAVIRSALRGLKQVINDKGIQLEVELPQAAVRVEGDSDRLVQVMVNLISNAVKFCASEVGKIGVSLEVKEGKACLLVWDNGEGISEGQQKTLFHKFTQFEQAVNTKASGSGLGLSISQGIIQHHGGQIAVDSREGGGAAFRVYLPLKRPHAAH